MDRVAERRRVLSAGRPGSTRPGGRSHRCRRRLWRHALLRRRRAPDPAPARAPVLAVRAEVVRLLHQHRLMHRPYLGARGRADRRQHAADDGLGPLPAAPVRAGDVPARAHPGRRIPGPRHARHRHRAARLLPAPEPRRRLRTRVRHGARALRRDADAPGRASRSRRAEARRRRLCPAGAGAQAARRRPALVDVAAGRRRVEPRSGDVLPIVERSARVSVRPVFVLSLPRSGSTLLQRMLATHPEVATASEPWVLLPQLYALRERGAVAEYGHRTAARAIADFSDSLPGGRAAYLAEVRRSVMALYEQAAGEAAWFLDKTPRYHLVVDEIMELFPDARFVFLWRNPLAVAASMIESFGRGHWNLERYDVDLHGGLDRLIAAHERRDPRAVAVRFEDVVADPAAGTRAIFDLLEL